MSTATSQQSPVRRLLDRITFPVAVAYLWVIMILFGAIILETVMFYPNIFADPPASLELSMDFLTVTGPNDVFPPFGMACWGFGAAALLLTLRTRNVRWWIALSLAALVAEGVVSILFFWPRNDIMFTEGLAVHSAEYLQQVAHEFQTWHWRSRMLFNGIAAVSVFIGFLNLHRNRVLALCRDR
ncbi:hypothetical protein GCM10022261_14670 [Brevibacterium daeguense]|uniref:DUF1772 domain-containing protein n=1 Tax=Brevibacterium daeguense TaxID=909936 RepID=A0ABP8EJ61_9MICO|nr:hypothetical protein [Brevibacterium daeguense]